MKPSTITFSDIQTRELLYYDESIENICFQFCYDRNIDCLPSLKDPLMYYKRTDGVFLADNITLERKVLCEDFIFTKSLLEKFRDYSLLFVYSNEDLTGVVHFSDYNRPEVNSFLFNLLASYERSLRKLLLLSGLKNQDMLDYFNSVASTTKKDQTKTYYMNKVEEFEKNRSQNELLPHFEKFYLKDLMELAKKREIIKVDQSVNDLRNDLMHAHDLVTLQDANRDDFIYNFKSFERFFNRVIVLLQDFKMVNNRIAFAELLRR